MFLTIRPTHRGKTPGIGLVFLMLALPFSALPQLGKELGERAQPPLGSRASEAQIVDGLKETLAIGASNAVSVTGMKDGFFRNERIKILIPDDMRALEQGLRMAGQGLNIDRFELSMNRAAESSVSGVLPILRNAIANMKVGDARGVLNGGATAASDYLKSTHLAAVSATARPFVENAMRKSAVETQYDGLVTQMKGLTFGQANPVDIEAFVVSKTLDGLFFMLGREEAKIRSTPASQVTPLLRELFIRD